MPVTTTAFTACDAVIELDNGSGVATDISGSSSQTTINFDAKIGEFRAFGTEWPSRVQCGKDASITIRGIATTAANEIRQIVEDWFFNSSGTARTFTLKMPAGNTGNQSYSAEVFLVSFSFDLDAASSDPVMYSIELRPTGAVTYNASIS